MSYSVIIIGAGAAGLSAATALLDAGLEPLVLEAADQVGGRVRSLEGFAGFPIELGAEEVHGEGNAVYDLVRNPAAEIIRHVTSDDRIRLDGRLWSLAEASMDEDVARAMEVLQSIGEYSGENWTAQDWLRRTHFPRRAWHYLDSRLGVEHGTTLDRLAMRGFSGYERGWENREGNFTLRGRYLDLFEPMIGRLGDRIWTGCPVTSIAREGQPRVTLADGRELTAEAVLVTASVAVLRDEGLVFDPPLPPDKLMAFQGVGMDAGMKVLLQFRERFWEESLYFLHTDGFLPQFWVTGRKKSTEPVLTAFIGGSRMETLTRMTVDPVQFALGELDAIFGGKTATGLFERGHVADWGADPWVRGLYSYPTKATTSKVRLILGRAEGRVFFAGEATDTHGHSATVHGAMDTGRRAAEQIVTTLGREAAG